MQCRCSGRLHFILCLTGLDLAQHLDCGLSRLLAHPAKARDLGVLKGRTQGEQIHQLKALDGRVRANFLSPQPLRLFHCVVFVPGPMHRFEIQAVELLGLLTRRLIQRRQIVAFASNGH